MSHQSQPVDHGDSHQQPTEQDSSSASTSGGPYVPSPPPPPKRRGLHPLAIVAIVLGSVLALCCIGGAVAMVMNPDEEADTTADDPPPQTATDGSPPAERTEEDEQAAPAIGDPVRDGKFELVVSDVETGIESVGDEPFGKRAQGQFVFVHLTVENIGDEAQRFDGSSQVLFDTEGREHSADGEAAIYVEDSESFLNDINPGNKVDGIVIFDIPADATPASLRLHDSPFSGGVEVSLRDR